MFGMLLALLLAFGPQPAVVAVTTQVTTTYQTYLRPRYESYGYSGTLTLRISSDGIVNGTYRPDSGSPFPSAVTGGVDGSKIWLDIPTLGGVHIEGTIKNGRIDGLGPSRASNRNYVFSATPKSPH
jgi:hypothetical protein